MPEYIEREAFREVLRKSHNARKRNSREGSLLERDIRLLDEQPAADVVAVVRCKECKFRGDEDDCPLLSLSAYTEPDDFCSYGERRGEDENA